jgi:hypothetical protein
MGRRGSGRVRAPKPKPEYKDASPEVQKIAADIISKVHGCLAEAGITYLFRTGKWENRGQLVYGKADKCSAKQKHFTGSDFVVIINKDIWDANPDKKKREAIMDNTLSYCGRGDDDKEGNPKWCINTPMTVFSGVIRRNGLWTDGLQTIARAKDEYEQMQIIPFDKAKNEDKKTGTDN